MPAGGGIWDEMAVQVELSFLDSRARSLDVQIAQLTEERSDVEGARNALRQQQRQQQRPAYTPAADEQELALRLAALFLGDVEPHLYQIKAACAFHAGRDVYVVQSAGRGKSLCYQLAGLLSRPPPAPAAPKPAQLTVVLSPIVALMHEQAATINAVRAYRMAIGGPVKSAYVLDGDGGSLLLDLDGEAPPTLEALVSSLRGDEGHATPLHPASPEALLLHRLQEPDANGEGMCIFVFISPEKYARSKSFHTFLHSAYELGLWRKTVIDEAHCIDEHGREFRPDYLLLGALRLAFPKIVVMCLTATAPPEVIVSTCLTLGITSDLLLLRGLLKRSQMRYDVRFVPNAGAKEKLICDAVAAARRRGESTLVYTNTRRATEQLAKAFREACAGSSAPEIDSYHAGKAPELRRAIEANWRGNVTTQLSATIAMGMGMDKPDLDSVIHHQVPKSIGALYQEASRAGRAGQHGRWNGIFTLADVFDLLERRHGQLASGRAEHEYGWGLSIDLLRFLMDGETCRHVLLERTLGGGDEIDEAKVCCQSDAPPCDNCARCAAAPEGDAVTLLRKDWIPALLQVMDEQEQASGGSLSLRAFARAWLRSPLAPKPVWARAALFLLALIHDVLCVSFVEIRSQDDDLLHSKPRVVRWSARVTIDVRGKRVARLSPVLRSVRVPASMWGPLTQATAEDDGFYNDLVMEIAAGEEDGSDLDSDSDERSERESSDGEVEPE